MENKLRVIDFFCGAGGFSEGFRQQGFKIVMGIDNWKQAINTHNLNHGLQDTVCDILQFEEDIENITSLPDTEIIIGSPPCVTFSMSNKAGKADKALGLRLIEAYLRVITVKKYQPNSILKGWLMENVPNSRNFVKEFYTFDDLNLSQWVKKIGKKGTDIALRVKNNGGLFTASDYGSPQSRQRFICGEMVESGDFPIPIITHGKESDLFGHKSYITLGEIKRQMPSPLNYDVDKEWDDPNYPKLKVGNKELTDQFYDTGLYQVEWEMAKFQKVNHPFMGRMSFPEDETKPSRTIMATRSASTREAIIFVSEFDRKGDGEFRLPTIREIATLMGFPYTYQFTGSEGNKWKQIGNAVCPHMASALAMTIRRKLDLEIISTRDIDFSSLSETYKKVNDLNNPIRKTFTNPPKKMRGSKYRRHTFKTGNMTIGLTNFNPTKDSSKKTNGQIWYSTIFLGSGKSYITIPITDELHTETENLILERTQNGKQLIKEFKKRFKAKIGSFNELQRIYESGEMTLGKISNPILLVDEIRDFISDYDKNNELLPRIRLNGIWKDTIPKRQLFSIWSMGEVIKVSQKKSSLKKDKNKKQTVA